MNERIVCLDIGDVRIGIAVSDETRTIATPVEVLKRVGWGPDVKHIAAVCAQYNTTEILSGLPLNMDGSAGFQTQKVQQFCQQLEKAGLTVYYQDERLTTVTAENALLEDNMSRAGRKQNVDKVAAAVILQQWLDTQKNQPVQTETNESEANTMEEANGIVELIDEEGNTVEFEHMATMEHEGKYYIVLYPITEEEDEDEGFVILEIAQDEEGNEFYASVEDDQLADMLAEKFLALLEEEGEEGDEEATEE
ncbi:MAG: Holliday junction resolvase RuvX [Clostridia bacterium]|nr:Holliday junction resolvase RuvX [Clostridia bacterium]